MALILGKELYREALNLQKQLKILEGFEGCRPMTLLSHSQWKSGICVVSCGSSSLLLIRTQLKNDSEKL